MFCKSKFAVCMLRSARRLFVTRSTCLDRAPILGFHIKWTPGVAKVFTALMLGYSVVTTYWLGIAKMAMSFITAKRSNNNYIIENWLTAEIGRYSGLKMTFPKYLLLKLFTLGYGTPRKVEPNCLLSKTRHRAGNTTRSNQIFVAQIRFFIRSMDSIILYSFTWFSLEYVKFQQIKYCSFEDKKNYVGVASPSLYNMYLHLKICRMITD